MSLLALAGTNSATGGYEIANSLKFEDDNDEWLYRTNATGTNRRTWTVSWWFKQTELRSVNGAAAEHWQGGGYGEATRAGIFADDRIWIDIGGGDGNTGTLFRSLSTARLRDTAAWYHIVIACDSTQSTEADRLKVWLNGVEVTAWDQRQYPTLNYESALQGTGGVQMKWGSADATYHGYSGYLAECNYLDGVTATQNDFGEFDDDSGIWKPKAYTGSYGTNGSYLDFSDASDLGANAKGNDVNFTLNNITSADQATDTPTNNFCIGNALVNYQGVAGGGQTLSEGATKFTNPAGQNWQSITGTFGLTKGKWYWEFKTNGAGSFTGIADVEDAFIPQNVNGYFVGFQDNQATKSLGMYSANGVIYNDTGSATGTSYNYTNTVGIALDMDNRKIYFAVDNTYTNSSNPATGSNGAAWATDWSNTVTPAFSCASGSFNVSINFGGFTFSSISSAATDANGYGTFEYAPPSGYYALCTKNLEEFG